MNILKKYQKDNGLTLIEMARIAGVHKGVLSKHLNGKRQISPLSAARYERAFNLPFRKLVEGEDVE